MNPGSRWSKLDALWSLLAALCRRGSGLAAGAADDGGGEEQDIRDGARSRGMVRERSITCCSRTGN